MNSATTLIYLSLILIIDMAGMLWIIQEKHTYYRLFLEIFAIGFVEILVNMISAVAVDRQTIIILQSIYYIGVTFETMFIWTLIWHYIYGNRRMAVFYSLIGGLTLLDVLVMLLNIFTEFVFRIELVNNVSRGFSYTVINQFPGSIIHFAICAFIGVLTVVLLLVRVYKTRGLYRIRYSLIASMHILAIMVGLLNGAADMPVVVIQFGNMAIALINYYLICHLVPEQLTRITVEETLRNLNSGLLIFDVEGHLVVCNEIGYDFLKVQRGDEEGVKKRIEDLLTEQNAWNNDHTRWLMEIQQEDNSTRYVQVDTARMKDQTDQVIGGYVNLSDRTQEQQTLQAEHFKATHDELTGLLNKEGFFEYVSLKMRNNPEDDYLIICTNVRDFKMVNDLFGFDRGNELIQKMATMLAMSLHKEELVGRIVADQFAILTRKSIFDDTYFMDQIQGITNIITSSYYTMTIHCGLYEVVNTEMDVSLMCDRANMAISTLRDRADNCMATYQDAMMASILHDRQVAGRLEKAVALGEFVIYLQSQVDSEGIPCGAEALVRWNDPNKGILGPGDFIDILEKTGCLYQLDQHVWELAAKQLSDWKGTVFSNLYISVNISPKDFYYVDIYKTFTGLVDRYKIDPAKLKLEITESALMKEPARQFQIINRLHNVGFQFEIDDFGSGYSSLSMLKDMPADILKIDMEFLHETENRGRSKTILDSVIKLAHELDMTVITEGVEKKSQVDFLSNMGCEIFQGYYFSRPVTVSEFEKKYRNLVKLKRKYD